MNRRGPCRWSAGHRLRHLARRLVGDAPLLRDGDAVTPVIGSIMILGITVMGIAAVMVWGGPALQRVQEQGAQGAMLGEFQEIRRDTLVLSITDASRVPRINLEAGTFGLRDGTRTQISAMFDAANTGCDFHVTAWGTPAGAHIAEATLTGCRAVGSSSPSCSSDCLRVYRVTGSNMVERPALVSGSGGSITITLASGLDLRAGDWMFAITSSTGTTRYAEAWLMSSHAVFWELQGAGEVGLQLEAGAIFSSRDGTQFLEADPPIAEEAAGNPLDFVIEWHTYSGQVGSYSGRSTPSLFLGLVGNNLRLSQDEVHRLRMDFEGEYAQAWCNTMLFRNHRIDGTYTSDGGCDAAGPARRGVMYQAQANQPFQFELIHARITTAL